MADPGGVARVPARRDHQVRAVGDDYGLLTVVCSCGEELVTFRKGWADISELVVAVAGHAPVGGGMLTRTMLVVSGWDDPKVPVPGG